MQPCTRLRQAFAIAAATLWMAIGGAAYAAEAPAKPQQVAQAAPHNSAPIWRGVRQGEPGISTIRGAETGVLVDSRGEAWRQFRNGPLTLVGGAALGFIAYRSSQPKSKLKGSPLDRR